MMKMAGSEPGSECGSISQGLGSADPDPDPHQNVMDPQHREEETTNQVWKMWEGNLEIERGNQGDQR
jgi:hypothetical protein